MSNDLECSFGVFRMHQESIMNTTQEHTEHSPGVSRMVFEGVRYAPGEHP